MVLDRVGEGRGDTPRVPLLETLERLFHALTGRIRTRSLDSLGGHERPQPTPHIWRGVCIVGMMLLMPLHQRLHAGDVLAPVRDILNAVHTLGRLAGQTRRPLVDS